MSNARARSASSTASFLSNINNIRDPHLAGRSGQATRQLITGIITQMYHPDIIPHNSFFKQITLLQEVAGWGEYGI